MKIFFSRFFLDKNSKIGSQSSQNIFTRQSGTKDDSKSQYCAFYPWKDGLEILPYQARKSLNKAWTPLPEAWKCLNNIFRLEQHPYSSSNPVVHKNAFFVSRFVTRSVFQKNVTKLVTFSIHYFALNVVKKRPCGRRKWEVSACSALQADWATCAQLQKEHIG